MKFKEINSNFYKFRSFENELKAYNFDVALI